MAVYKVVSAEQTISGVVPPSKYWINYLTETGTNARVAVGIDTDTTGNIYTIYYKDNGNGIIVKTDTYGKVLWQFRISTFNNGETDAGIKFSNGFIYITYTGVVSTYPSMIVMKLNADTGALQWQRYSNIANAQGVQSKGAIDVDSSGNVYVGGMVYYNSRWQHYVIKYDANGTYQWEIIGETSWSKISGLKVDSTGANIYVCGHQDIGGAGNNYNFFVGKFSSAGAIQWQKTLGVAGNNYQEARNLVLDSSDNVYVYGYSDQLPVNQQGLQIVKYNSSGTIQWQRSVSSISADRPKAIKIGPDNNLYISVMGYTSSDGNGFIKYDLNGNVLLQRKITFNGSAPGTLNGIHTDTSGNVFLFGQPGNGITDAYQDGYVLKIPNDGTYLGSYSIVKLNFSYYTGTWSTGTNALTEATGAVSFNNNSAITTRGTSGFGWIASGFSILKVDLV